MDTPNHPRLFVGLGNPGKTYVGTRHNVGRDFIEFSSSLTQAFPAKFAILDCYMNESGPPILRLMKKDGIKPHEVVIIVDDFMIPFGSLRFRAKGSSGGHNGLKSIIEVLGTEEFGRLRVGVGPVPETQDPADYVLKKFLKTEKDKLPNLYTAIKASIEKFFEVGIQKAMTDVNKQHF